jgi:hypothetical protein
MDDLEDDSIFNFAPNAVRQHKAAGGPVILTPIKGIPGKESRTKLAVNAREGGDLPQWVTEVWLRIEIKRKGPHPCPYFRTVTSHPWSTTDIVCQLAICIT